MDYTLLLPMMVAVVDTAATVIANTAAVSLCVHSSQFTVAIELLFEQVDIERNHELHLYGHALASATGAVRVLRLSYRSYG